MNAANSYIENAFDTRRRVGKQSFDAGFDWGNELQSDWDADNGLIDWEQEQFRDSTTGDLGSLPDPLTTLGNTDYELVNPDFINQDYDPDSFSAFGGDNSNLPSRSGSSGGTGVKGFFDFLGSAAGAVSKIAGVITSTGKGNQNKVTPVASGGNSPLRNTNSAADAGSGGGDVDTIDGGYSVHRTDSRPAFLQGTPSWTIPVLIIVATFFIIKRYWKR